MAQKNVHIVLDPFSSVGAPKPVSNKLTLYKYESLKAYESSLLCILSGALLNGCVR